MEKAAQRTMTMERTVFMFIVTICVTGYLGFFRLDSAELGLFQLRSTARARDDDIAVEFTSSQPCARTTTTRNVSQRRLGRLIPADEGRLTYALILIGTASMIEAVYGGRFARRRWTSDTDINRKVPPAWGPHMRDYPLRK